MNGCLKLLIVVIITQVERLHNNIFLVERKSELSYTYEWKFMDMLRHSYIICIIPTSRSEGEINRDILNRTVYLREYSLPKSKSRERLEHSSYFLLLSQYIFFRELHGINFQESLRSLLLKLCKKLGSSVIILLNANDILIKIIAIKISV